MGKFRKIKLILLHTFQLFSINKKPVVLLTIIFPGSEQTDVILQSSGKAHPVVKAQYTEISEKINAVADTGVFLIKSECLAGQFIQFLTQRVISHIIFDQSHSVLSSSLHCIYCHIA